MTWILQASIHNTVISRTGPAPDQANQHPSLDDGWVTPIHGAVDFGWMLSKGSSLYFGDVAAVDCLGPGRWPHILVYMGSSNWTMGC